MYTATDLIEVLKRRWLLAAPRRAPGEFPPGWRAWFASMQARTDAVTGATAQSILDVLLQRPLAARPRRSDELSRWQAFNTLWRQDWHAPEPEDRRLRWFAGTFTVLWHVFVGGMLLWMMHARFLALETEASKRRGENVVQVEFVGRGTPEEVGGAPSGPPPVEPPPMEAAPTGAPDASGSASVPDEVETADVAADLSVPAAPPEVRGDVRVEASIPEVEERAVPEPQPPPVSLAEQEVDVSAPTPEPTDFVLPSPAARIASPPVAVPEVAPPERPLQAVEIPEPARLRRRDAPRPTIASPRIDTAAPEVVRRDVPAPLPRVRLPEVPSPVLPQPVVRAPDAPVRAREIPVPVPAAAAGAPSPADAAQPASSPATAAPISTATTMPPTTPAPGRPVGTMQPADELPQAGLGPKPLAAPGGFPTPAKADDWGESAREVPGEQRGEPLGLYDAEGGPRLTDHPVNTGQPPGTVDDRIIDLDRSGTWLRRKPTPYEPTAFDAYWIPRETLLEEWVRKGIKRMVIPIPGTNKKIECLVSTLALGGACGISDPNLNEQPAGARPPPDIPFKPHLQEGNSGAEAPAQGEENSGGDQEPRAPA